MVTTPWRRLVGINRAGIVAVGLFVLASLLSPPAASAAETAGNWNLDDGAGHRLGGMLYEASDINAAKGLRLRLNAESPKLTLSHARPLRLSDGKDQDWSLTNRSDELTASAGGAIPATSSQFDAGCLDPTPADGLPLKITVPSSLVALAALGHWPTAELPLLFPLVGGGVLGAVVGQRLAPHLPEVRLRQGFSALLIGSALLTGFEAWRRHDHPPAVSRAAASRQGVRSPSWPASPVSPSSTVSIAP